MAVEISITTTVLPGGKIEVNSPELVAGQQATVRVTLEVERLPTHDTTQPLPDEPNTQQPEPINRRAFMKLPLAERRRILAAQADSLATHYEQDPDWRDFQAVESARVDAVPALKHRAIKQRPMEWG